MKKIKYKNTLKITCPHCGDESKDEPNLVWDLFCEYWIKRRPHLEPHKKSDQIFDLFCHGCQKSFFIQMKVDVPRFFSKKTHNGKRAIGDIY